MTDRVPHGLDARDVYRPKHGLKQPDKIGLDHGGILSVHSSSIRLVDITLVSVSSYNNFVGMRALAGGVVFEVNEARRHKDEQQNHRDHDVIVKASALVRPKEIAFDRAPDAGHGTSL